MFSSKGQAYQEIERHYREHSDRLVKQLSIKSRGVHNAEDIVQDMYTKALMYWQTWRGDADIDTWLTEIRKNTAKDHMTREKLHGAVGKGHDQIVEDEPINHSGPARLELEDIRKRILSKRGKKQQVLVMALLDQMPYHLIEKKAHISNKDIRQHVWEFRREIGA